MRILVDTNILISALYYPNGTPAKALYHIAKNHNLVLCDQNIAELRKIAREKFTDKQADIDCFLAELTYELISAVDTPEKIIADPKDAPILNAAIITNVDIIISGDKHFLSLSLDKPKIHKASDYLYLAGTEC